MKAELTRDYDNWKLTDWREERKKDMPKLLSDYHIDQYIIKELTKEQAFNFLHDFSKTYQEKYNFKNLEIAEHNIVGQEQINGGIVYTMQIVWTNIREVIVENEEDLKNIINKEVDEMWADDDTIDVEYEIDVTEEYWG